MNSYERFFAVMRGEETDCFPVTPYNGNFAIALAGMEISECYTSGKALAEAQIRAWEKIRQDVVVAQSDQYYIPEAFGLKTRYRKGALPEVLETPLKSLDDVGSLKPIDPYRDGRCSVYIEAVGLLAAHFKNEVPVRAPGAGAFVLAGHLLGIDRFITEIAAAEAEEDEKTVERIFALLEIAYDAHYRYCEACVKAGAAIVQCADSLASLNMISPKIYGKYAFPYERRFFERINALKKDYDFYTLLHICGNNTLIAEKLMATGCDILEVDYQIDLAYYKKLAGSRVCLMGNLNPAGALLRGTPREVEAEAAAALEKAGNRGRFFLGSGCEVAAHTPVENLLALIRAGRSRKPVF
jgi:uroporphyrinogen decarboxylase